MNIQNASIVDSHVQQAPDLIVQTVNCQKQPRGRFITVIVTLMLALPLASFHVVDVMKTQENVAIETTSIHSAAEPIQIQETPAPVIGPLPVIKEISAPEVVTVDDDITSMPEQDMNLAATPVPPRDMTAEEKRLLRKAQRHVALGYPLETLDTSPPSPVVTQINPYNKVGVFLTPSSTGRDQFLGDTLDSLSENEGDALVFDAKGSFVYFDADAPIAEDLELENPAYDLHEVIAKAHEKGIYTIARFVAIKDAGLTRKLPETRVRHPQSNQVISQEWIDPENEKALAYNMEAICNLAAAGIDEINLDYIRFSTSEFGALLAFSTEEKAKKVSTFITRARETINRCNPATKLGLSTYAILGWSYDVNVRTLGQDVVSFAPLVDVISPMAYPATFTTDAYYDPAKHPGSRMYWLVHRTLTGYQELLGPEHAHKLRPWIQGYGITTKNMNDQIKAVFDANICGFTVWNADNAYAVAYKGIKQMQKPENCF